MQNRKIVVLIVNPTTIYGKQMLANSRVHYLSHHRGGARIVMVIVVGNGHGDTSSNPGRD